ncbi:hypothetical protein VTK73DRAFT_3486 [Phialemonium thermophilum]|uniref:Uncharacterized protein n=1 Tax=Phialemonium thermophilum TaxID=223376 RepID=A0ABR3VHT7_9PEZI
MTNLSSSTTRPSREGEKKNLPGLFFSSSQLTGSLDPPGQPTSHPARLPLGWQRVSWFRPVSPSVSLSLSSSVGTRATTVVDASAPVCHTRLDTTRYWPLAPVRLLLFWHLTSMGLALGPEWAPRAVGSSLFSAILPLSSSLSPPPTPPSLSLARSVALPTFASSVS